PNAGGCALWRLRFAALSSGIGKRVPAERAPDQLEFRRAGKRRSVLESVVTDRFNRVKHRQAAAAEQFNVDAKRGDHRLRERQTFLEQFTSAIDKNAHERGIAVVEVSGKKFGFADTVLSHQVGGNINAVLVQIP